MHSNCSQVGVKKMKRKVNDINRRIVIFALRNIGNFGEELLCDTTRFLLRKVNPRIEINVAQFSPGTKDLYGIGFWRVIVGAFVERVSRVLPILRTYLLDLRFQVRDAAYCRVAISDADCVVTAYGMLKYSTQCAASGFYRLAKESARQGKPFFISAVSPQRPDVSDWRCRQLMRAINCQSVKMITTRDGKSGVDRIRSGYVTDNASCRILKVGDPALWAADCYGIHRREHSSTIGIGMVRSGVFEDYGGGVSAKELEIVYLQLIDDLERNHVDWRLFTNGMPDDIEFAKRLLSKKNYPQEKLLPRANDAAEFVRQIAGFKVVFGGRLHANIVSASLGIPFVGMRWDDKFAGFFASTGRSFFLLEPNELEEGAIYRRIKLACNSSVDMATIENLKMKTLHSFRMFSDEFII